MTLTSGWLELSGQLAQKAAIPQLLRMEDLIGDSSPTRCRTKCSASLPVLSPVSGQVWAPQHCARSISGEYVGSGLAIVPIIGQVQAPVAGEVIAVWPGGHAIGIRTKEGAEILLHIGVRTYGLINCEFTCYIAESEQVTPGQTLLEWDKDELAKRGYDTTVYVTCVNDSEFTICQSLDCDTVASGDWLFSLHN